MNNVILIGRLTKDPELRYMTNKTEIANFTIAIPREYGEEVDYIECVAFSKVANNIVKYTSKGSMIAIQGSIRVDTYQTKDGKNAKSFKVNATKVQFLDTKSNKVDGSTLGEVNHNSWDPEVPF